MSTKKKGKTDGLAIFTAMSLCSGYEGISLGLRRAIPNIRTICYVENEAYACANLVAKIKKGLLDDAPVWDDIKTFDGKPFAGMVDIIHSGYPCQCFSSAGRRRGKEDPRYLWPDIERIVKTVRPAWCFFENVEGHLKIGFDDVYRGLRKMGYAVEAGLFSAAEVGAPHRRKRLFVLAHHPNRGCETMQVQQEGQSALEHGRKKLADAEGDQGKIHARPGTEGSGASDIRRRSKLADSERAEPGPGAIKETSTANGRDRPAIDRWPARPGQAQYEWEEPRTVDNALHRRHEQEKGQIQTGGDGVEHADKGKAEPELG